MDNNRKYSIILINKKIKKIYNKIQNKQIKIIK